MVARLIVLLVIFLSCIAHDVEAKKLYKWVDEDGRVHYSDKVPPEQNKLAREELNQEGVVTGKVARAKTKEEMAAEEEVMKIARLQAIEAEKEKERIKKEKNTILKSYINEDEIIRTKEERISGLNRNIEAAEQNLLIQQRNHEDLLLRAADKERNGEVVSEAFKSQIETVKKQIQYQKDYISDKQAEIIELGKKYDYDLEKYREYSGKSAVVKTDS